MLGRAWCWEGVALAGLVLGGHALEDVVLGKMRPSDKALWWVHPIGMQGRLGRRLGPGGIALGWVCPEGVALRRVWP